MKNEKFVSCEELKIMTTKQAADQNLFFLLEKKQFPVFVDVTDEQGHKIPKRFLYKREYSNGH